MSKEERRYLLWRLGAISFFAVSVNIVMMERLVHTYFAAACAVIVGLWCMLKASSLEERVRRCFVNDRSLELFVAQTLFFVCGALFAIASFGCLVFGEVEVNACVLGLFGMMAGWISLVKICKKAKR